jgi:hypothetical protein
MSEFQSENNCWKTVGNNLICANNNKNQKCFFNYF